MNLKERTKQRGTNAEVDVLGLEARGELRDNHRRYRATRVKDWPAAIAGLYGGGYLHVSTVTADSAERRHNASGYMLDPV